MIDMTMADLMGGEPVELIKECSSCRHHDVAAAIAHRDGDRPGWGYCRRMHSEFLGNIHGDMSETSLGTLAVATDSAYGRGDEVDVLTAPNFGCVMHEERHSAPPEA